MESLIRKHSRDKEVRLIQANKPESLIRKHSPKTDKFSNVCIMNGEIMNSPKGMQSVVPERVSIHCPTCGTRHELRKITGKYSHVSQLANKPVNRLSSLWKRSV